MEPWTRMEFQALVLAVAARGMARAGDDDDSDHPFKVAREFESPDERKPKPWLLPSAWVFITGFGWMAVAVVVSIVTCIYRHVKRKCILGRMTVQERLMPPPLAPARSCAPRYSNRGQQPLISGAMAPPVVPYPAQQCGNPPQSVPCTQVTLYNAWNGESLPPPSAPPPTAPLDTPASFSYDPVYKQ
ncbi:uncharacterized protein LOC144162438 isoform X2 [Haemaphysalis longicornis]